MSAALHRLYIAKTSRPHYVYDGYPDRLPRISPLPLRRWYTVREYRLEQDCAWVTSEGWAIIGRVGDRINGASTPWILRRILARSMRPDGSLFLPSIFHDLGYQGREVCVYDSDGVCREIVQPCRSWFDDEFRAAMPYSPDHVSNTQGRLAYAGVMIGGARAWESYRAEREVSYG